MNSPSHWSRLVVAVLVLAGCGKSVSTISAIPAGDARCPGGDGIEVKTGDTSQVICSSITTVKPIATGDARCPGGGIEVRSGEKTDVICNKVAQLVAVKTVALNDSHCPAGGDAIETGLDNGANGGTAGDGTLQSGEVTSTTYVCQPAKQLTKQTTLAVGDANCAEGGLQLQFGLDDGRGGGTANDNTLQAGEVTSSQYVCSIEGTNVGSFLPPAGAVGAKSINLAGGAGSVGYGGNGGYFYEYFDYGSNGGHAKLFTSGTADASFTVPTAPSPDLGTLPLNVTSDLTIKYAEDTSGDGLSAGDYFVTGTATSPIYKWDGTAATQVTGVSIAAGKTLTIEVSDDNNTAAIRIDRTLRNAGRIVTHTESETLAGSLYLDVGDYWGEAGSSIDLSGADKATGSDGVHGGNFTLYSTRWQNNSYYGGGFVNRGTINTSGGDGDNGGNGGQVYVETSSGIVNTGAITTTGGVGAVTNGGSGGLIYFDAYYGSFSNSGGMNSSGGQGKINGGSATRINLYADDVGDVRNSGNLSAIGGDSTDCEGECGGGSGAQIYLYADGGDIVSSGELDAHGGAGSGGSGGSGGQIYMYTDATPNWVSNAYVSKGSITVSGGINAAGGSGGWGGNAGTFEAELYGSYRAPSGQELTLLGYGGGVNQNGGNGVSYGGNGGNFYLDNEAGVTESVYIPNWGNQEVDHMPGGSVINNVNVTNKGGSSTEGYGGNGGYLYLSTQQSYHFLQRIEFLMNSGNLNNSGGDGVTAGGQSGYVFLYAGHGVTNSGSITSNGGSASGENAAGGANQSYDGWNGIMSDDGDITNSGNLSFNGGSSTGTGGTGASSSNPVTFRANSITNSGNVSAKGGNGVAAGGNGAPVTFSSVAGKTTNTGNVNVAGGTGTAAGTAGSFAVDGHFVGPD